MSAVLRGVRNQVRVRALGSGAEVRHERVGGPLRTVPAVGQDGELDVYREHTRD
ncbi:hypothetical protein [Streptomyces altiplanensis]